MCFFNVMKFYHRWGNKSDKIENSSNKIKLLLGLVKEHATVTLLIISAVFPYF